MILSLFLMKFGRCQGWKMTWTLTMRTMEKAKDCKRKHLALTVSLQTIASIGALEHLTVNQQDVTQRVKNMGVVCVFCALQDLLQKLN